MGVSICLHYDGFFSFAVVRQNGLLFLNGVRFFLCELTIFNCIRNSFI